MNGPQGSALASLASNLSQRDSQNQINQDYINLNRFVDQENAQKQLAAAQEQQYYDAISKQAEGMLAYDRQKVNEMSLRFQRDVKDKIKMYGGSLRRFMQNGGQRILGDYKRSILNSEEFNTFKENKENLARIMDAQQNGYGHLLLDKDLESLQQYQKNEGGKISYSGMMQDIKMPPSEDYNLGEQIPLEDILNYGDNYMKLVANYKMYYPDLPDPNTEKLMSFAKQMGYGGKGSNRDLLDYERQLRLAAYRAALNKKQEAPVPKEDKRGVDVVTEATRVLTMFPKDMTVDQLAEQYYDDKGGNFYTKTMESGEGDAYLKNNLSPDWNVSGRLKTYDSQGADMNDLLTKGGIFPENMVPGFIKDAGKKALEGYDYLTKNKYSLAHAAKAFSGFENSVAKAVFGKDVINGLVEFDPSTDRTLYRVDGQQLSGENALDENDLAGKYEVLGISTAVKTKSEKGGYSLLTNALKDNGELDAEATQNQLDQQKGNTAAPVYVVALQKGDDIFYKEVEMTEGMRSRIKENIGDAADISDEREASQRNADVFEVANRMTAQEEAQVRQSILTIDQEIDNIPDFELEAADFSNGELNRSALIKSFYIANKNASAPASTLASDQMFSRMIQAAGGDVLSEMKDFHNNYSDEELIDLWVKTMNNDETLSQESIRSNIQAGERWKQVLRKYKKINEI